MALPTSGKLENAAYAVFSSNLGNGDVVDENGRFLLQDGETVTFNDQFRRGSYIALQEQIDTELYDTTWTVYENDVPVTSVNGKTDVVTLAMLTHCKTSEAPLRTMAERNKWLIQPLTETTPRTRTKTPQKPDAARWFFALTAIRPMITS